ncbi:hypothetical protein YA0032_16405 [Pseudomonas amygdali]|uniref:hypothetical protein n=1 Tax=Pseudomonas syringae group TaxID=136849 RepID=UPI000EFF9C68|nr:MULTISPECIES: hypothetical protein [Pseudomonas syringae group]MBI6732275.1 hypothetical protein [Pseudomonas amygdali]MBI6812738.1 hypothetical protein [Pseudomonas amygdali]MCH5535168.1 hypothetical protein [Pseudomonas syringae pv. syringae]RMO94397.1 hypothetical protein ALQ31_01685 [Pseudomonas amygdali pv. morsprunorum]
MRVIKVILSVFAVILLTMLLARFMIGSGLVQAALDTPLGNSIYISMKNLFGVAGGEDGEGFVIDLVITASFIFVVLVCWLLSKLKAKISQAKS